MVLWRCPVLSSTGQVTPNLLMCISVFSTFNNVLSIGRGVENDPLFMRKVDLQGNNVRFLT